MWEKLGRIYEPKAKGEKLLTHAANPLVLKISADVVRVFYNGRDGQNRSSLSSFDYNLATKVMVEEKHEPWITHGADNEFHSHGISNGCLIRTANGWEMLFMAWQIRGQNHWRGDIGSVNVSLDGSVDASSAKCWMTTDGNVDKVSLSYPWIVQFKGRYFMYYGSTHTWDAGNGEMIHAIHVAVSEDAKNWNRLGPAIEPQVGVAQAFSRPTIAVVGDRLKMWFSYRSGDGTAYRIGSASSDDGLQWQADYSGDDIDVSEKGWDSKMVCYPCTFTYRDELFLMYNGNGYGKTGIGLCRWKG